MKPEIVKKISEFKAPSDAEIQKLSAAEAEAKGAEALDLVTQFFDAQDEHKDLSADPEVKQHVITLNKSAEDLLAFAKEQLKFEGIGESARERKGQINRPANGLESGPGRDPANGKSMGQQFIESPGYKELMDRFAKYGDSEAAGKIGRVGMQVKTLVTDDSATSAGAFATPARQPTVDLIYRELTILDLINRGQTDSDTIEFIRQVSVTNNAAMMPEATAVTDALAKSPESAFAFEKETTNVKEISHYVPITRKALRNAPQMRMYIDQVLNYGVDEKLEDQVLNGDGTGDNLTGILSQTGLSAQAWDTDLLTTLRKSRTVARITGKVKPTGYLLHPYDWETIDLLQDGENRYYYGGPQTIGQTRLWGLPVAESETIAEGIGVCGDFRHAFLLDRATTEILVSDSNEDWFLKKIIALLGIGYFAFYVDRPAAFVEADLTAV